MKIWLLRLLLWLALMAVLVLTLHQFPGLLSVDWLGYRLEVELMFLFPLLLITGIVWQMLYRIGALPQQWRLRKQSRHHQQTNAAFIAGITALVTMDIKGLRSAATSLERSSPMLSFWLLAQAAEAEGRPEDARKWYCKMHGDAALLGLMGQLHLREKQTKQDAALLPDAVRLAEEVVLQRPQLLMPAETLIRLYLAAHRFEDAEKVIALARKKAGMDKASAKIWQEKINELKARHPHGGNLLA
jgi:HemY protein